MFDSVPVSYFQNESASGSYLCLCEKIPQGVEARGEVDNQQVVDHEAIVVDPDAAPFKAVTTNG